jgi:hypothetical protein
MNVQSVVIPKKNFSLSQAKKWIKDNNYKLTFYGKPVDLTVGFYRFRQMAPSNFDKKTYKTKVLKNGILLIIGKLKK